MPEFSLKKLVVGALVCGGALASYYPGYYPPRPNNFIDGSWNNLRGNGNYLNGNWNNVAGNGNFVNGHGNNVQSY